jgi:UDP-N-acetylmuramoyl-tripeptide--D-alanyl-D-alanine ligase
VFSYLDATRLLGVAPELPDLSLTIRSLSIDTRTLQQGDLFVAFKGEHSDGHAFLSAAFHKGASGALIDAGQTDAALTGLRDMKTQVRNLIPVADPEAAMTTLAASYRKTLPVKVIGITGSVGKTTTKEFLAYLLRKKYSVLATAGNLNNHLGVPIMLSRLDTSHQYAVMEMGASASGEIRSLAGLAAPSGGIFTPIGPAHLAGFGSLENVYRTKLELADHLRPSDPLVVPGGDAKLLEMIRQKGRKAVTVGYSGGEEYQISSAKAVNGEVSFLLNARWPFSFPGQAPFLALNAGLAIAMARNLGLAWEEISPQWNDVDFASGRFRETMLPSGVRVIDDSYNANPVSFGNALVAFRELPAAGKKIVVFADMLELGAEEKRYHRELGERIAGSEACLAFAYGERTRSSIEALEGSGSRCLGRHFENSDETLEALKEVLRSGDLVLFKGSRGMHVEKVLDGIRHISVLTHT